MGVQQRANPSPVAAIRRPSLYIYLPRRSSDNPLPLPLYPIFFAIPGRTETSSPRASSLRLDSNRETVIVSCSWASSSSRGTHPPSFPPGANWMSSHFGPFLSWFSSQEASAPFRTALWPPPSLFLFVCSFRSLVRRKLPARRSVSPVAGMHSPSRARPGQRPLRAEKAWRLNRRAEGD